MGAAESEGVVIVAAEFVAVLAHASRVAAPVVEFVDCVPAAACAMRQSKTMMQPCMSIEGLDREDFVYGGVRLQEVLRDDAAHGVA